MNDTKVDPREAALLVLAKMSLCDGAIAPEERGYLLDLLDDAQADRLDELLAQAQTCTLESLAAAVGHYPDRFFIALRAYALAHVDAHYNLAEATLFDSLVQLLHITAEDVALIAATEAVVEDALDEPFPVRLAELFEQSSFAKL